MKKKIFVLLSFSLFVSAFTCGEDDNDAPCGETLNLGIGLTIYPFLIDTVHVGDTIWLEMIIMNQLMELNTGGMVDVANYDFNTRCSLNKMDTIDTPSAYASFEYITTKGSFDIFNINSGGAFAALGTEKGNNSQQCLTGLIPKQTGLFQVSFYTLRVDMTCQDLPFLGKDKNNLELQYKMNNGNNTENNYDMILGSPGLISTPKQFSDGAAYAFVVIE